MKKFLLLFVLLLFGCSSLNKESYCRENNFTNEECDSAWNSKLNEINRVYERSVHREIDRR